MTTLAVSSQKGGVGKTTVALNLAYAMATRGWRTLLVDADPQGAIGLSLKGSAAERPGLAELLRGEMVLEEAVITTRLPDLELLAVGQPTFGESCSWLREPSVRESFGELLDVASQDRDLILVDTAAGPYGPANGVLHAVSAVLVPIQAEPLAIRSLPGYLDAIEQIWGNSTSRRIAGVVLTMVQSRSMESLTVVQETLRLVPSDLAFDTFVSRDPVFLKASAAGVPLGLLHRPPPPAAAVFDQIAAELEPRLGLISEEVEDEARSLLD